MIEVDGGIHEKKGRKEYDVLRTRKLNKFGLTVIQFRNEEVKTNIEQVLAKINLFLEE